MGKKEDLEILKLQKLVNLGDKVHYKIRINEITDPKLCAISSEIIQIDKEIHALSGDTTPEKDDGVCPLCQTKLEENVKFCGNCGANIEEYYSKATVHCAKCESIISANDNFCPICGSKAEG